jgi:competence protein CoiA
MHAKVSSSGLRFFAHDALQPGCPSLGETAAHLELKRAIALAIRSTGCRAVLEAVPAVDDIGGWRADVLGISPGGRRSAFEVQLAGMTIEEGRQRTDRYADDGVGCVWVSSKNASWMTLLPSCHVLAADGALTADRGLARLVTKGLFARWEQAEPVEFHKVALGLLDGRVELVRERNYAETCGERSYFLREAVLLVGGEDVRRLASLKEAEREARTRFREIEERARLEHARRSANLKAFYERQERVLQIALEKAAADIRGGEIRLGVPPLPWDGAFPTSARSARGSEATAGGAVLWAQPEGSEPCLWGVVCPVAGKATRALGRSWRRRGVHVFVESDAEARRVAASLEWRASELTVVSKIAPGRDTVRASISA